MSTALASQFTKEAISSRMLQNAANLWGFKNPASLDPFVRLLTEAFSLEIFRVANESQNIESRILDKIADLLTPNLQVMPQAAHGILQAIPLAPVQELHPATHFYIERRLPARTDGTQGEVMDVEFTPAMSARLIRARITWLGAGTQLFRYDEASNRVPHRRASAPLPWATAYIGIAVDEDLQNLEGALLYVDFSAAEAQHWAHQLFNHAKATINGRPVAIYAGQQVPEPSFPEKPFDELLLDSTDIMKQITADVQQRYDGKLFTLGNFSIDAAEEYALPAALSQTFSADVFNRDPNKKCLWLELAFPPSYSYEVLESMNTALNAFPVLNRSLMRRTFSYKGLNSILPMRTGLHERFMAVHTVTDGHDRRLTEIPFSRTSGGTGCYSLRHGGAERFDDRSAQDIVAYLIELTRDEIAAFASLNQDFMLTALKDLSKLLRQLQARTDDAEINIRQVPAYLIAEPYDETDNLEVVWWICNAALANGIRTGTVMKAKGTPDFEKDSLIVLQTTMGGREGRQAGEKLDAYRYTLASRDQIITREDIRNFCRHELGSRLKEVRFNNGLAASANPRQGYIRTLDISLVPQRYAELPENEWQRLAQQLYARIVARSPEGNNYRVQFINDHSGAVGE